MKGNDESTILADADQINRTIDGRCECSPSTFRSSFTLH
jgi:hypothetical protein